jgi:hypothetical protein
MYSIFERFKQKRRLATAYYQRLQVFYISPKDFSKYQLKTI